ncbi:menaquinol-cytochrome c reductase cytochrome b/c subunit [Macrococcus equipercicus]|uniref:C-type cytochrome n=1 Tax=Macrococcus equipercicus TaxID=69967 RepID=A0A9Q9BS15_9STAP|nr:menaquinol-cytochrome c reductase cytochrome b/c subunit [Macrococcus equipercicus]KAA1040194.1 cytochrome C oxidase Cbb3 [Macrococcus equipercicus]UTH12861.1 c-type cytochrome [Macrococcus equipercicus]
MHKGKGMTFVGDSRIKQYKKAKLNRDYSEFPGKTESFWPDFLLKEWMTGAVFLVAFLCLTVAHPAPLERVADASDTGYTPLPDWYFLFLYQILKYTYASGPFNTFGAIILPGIAFGALLLAPWLDRGPERKWYKRPVASGLMLTAFAIIFYTTWESAAYHDWKKQEAQGAIAFTNLDKKDPTYEKIIKSNCTSCHGGELTGGAGPNLVKANLQPATVEAFVTHGNGAMPSFKDTLTKDQIKEVAKFVANLHETDESGKELKK